MTAAPTTRRFALDVVEHESYWYVIRTYQHSSDPTQAGVCELLGPCVSQEAAREFRDELKREAARLNTAHPESTREEWTAEPTFPHGTHPHLSR